MEGQEPPELLVRRVPRGLQRRPVLPPGLALLRRVRPVLSSERQRPERALPLAPRARQREAPLGAPPSAPMRSTLYTRRARVSGRERATMDS